MFTGSKLIASLAALVFAAFFSVPTAVSAQAPETPASAAPASAAPVPPDSSAPPAATPPASSLPDAPHAASAPSQLPDAPGAPQAGAAPIEPTGPLVVFDTSMGRLTCRLFDKQSPIAAANFIGLATGTKEYTDPVSGKKVKGVPFYDGTTFHRVIPNFMIQGGDRKGDGTGDAGYYFEDEQTPGLNFDVAGRLAMANSGPNTNGSQFFITEVPYPDLNGKYTIFGQCDTHSVLMVATIARVDRNANDKPLSPVTLNKVTIVRQGDPMPPLPATSETPASSPPSAPAVPMAPPS
jgi:peptidyl-prolyl cis-trans isomerase A (cyclophilin A)